VKVTASSSAVAGANTLKVTQLASNARLNSSSEASFDGTKTTLAEQLGLTAGTVNFTVNGSESITIDTSEDSIDTLVSKISGAKMADGSSAGVSASFDRTLQRMFISSTTSGSEAQVSFDAGTAADLFAKLNLDTSQVQYGTDAKIVLNGMSLTEAGNQFTFAGVTYTLTGTSDTETVNINLTSDTDAVYNSIKSFVDLYNTTIEKLNTKVSEGRDSDYLPLTDDEREELSEKQQEKWEEIAKTGLLRNDSLLNGVVRNMRDSISSFVSGMDAKYNCLLDLGIKTGAYYENGKLTIEDEEKLKKAINTNPQAVMELFTKTSDIPDEKGLATRLYDNLTNGIEQVIDKAGSDNSYSLVDNSVLGKKITDYDKQIDDWDDKLEELEDRYYEQYSALETALSRLNQQSSSLSQLLGTGD
jgi:flagellar hook-associated protein 2